MYAPRGQPFSFTVPLVLLDDTDFADVADYAPAAADFQVIKDGGAEANIATVPTELDIAAHSVAMYQINLTETEMQADEIVVVLVDAALEHNSWRIETQSGGEIWATSINDASPTSTGFVLAEGSAVDDVYNGCIIEVRDATTASSHSFGVITDYTGSTKTVTCTTLSDPATIADNDLVFIHAPSLMPTAFGRTLDVTAGGTAGIDWGNVENPTTAVDLSGTDIQLCDTITTYTGNTVQTGDAFARLGAPAGASVSADIAAVEAQTDDIGVAGAGLTAVPWNASWDAEVQSEVNDALVALGLDHLVGASVTGTDIVDNSIIAKLVSASLTADWDDFVNTTDSLQAIRDKQTDIETDTAEIGAAGAGLTALATAASISALNDLSAAAVNAEVVDVLRTDTNSELAQGIPPATPTFEEAVMFLYMALRNQMTTTASEMAVYNDAGTKIAKSTLSDDGTTFTNGEFVSGA